MKRMLMAAAGAAVVFLAACTEAPQEAGKVYAGKEDAKPYSGDQFKGDKQKWESALAARAEYQNEKNRGKVAK